VAIFIMRLATELMFGLLVIFAEALLNPIA
jgi:hypothetical protein